nr:ABC transporter substrate-binding protein [Phosphitispora fastidiosa]
MFSAVVFFGCSGKTGQQANEASGNQDLERIVYLTQTSPPNMLEQLKAGEIDGFIAWEPFNSTAVNNGDGKYLFTSREVWPGHPCCVLAVSDSFKDEQTVEAVTWAHIRAIRFINDAENRNKVLQYASAFTGKDEEVVKKSLENITYVEYPAKDKFMEYYSSLVEGKLLKNSVETIGYENSENFFASFLREDVNKKVSGELDQDAGWKPAGVKGDAPLRLGYLSADLHQLAMFVAEKEGYYEQVGLITGQNLETKMFANGVAVMEAFKAADVDIAYIGGAPATLKRINDNIPIEVVAGANNEGSGLVVKSDGKIKTLADLEGRTIAVPGIGTVQHTLLDKALREEGLRPVIK